MANMPEVNAVFGAAPEIAFPSDEAPKGLKGRGRSSRVTGRWSAAATR